MSAYDAFAPIYDEWAGHMTADVPFYIALASETEGPLVELAVGSGRVAIPVAEKAGKPVIGIDSSPAMLERARERAAAARVVLDLRQADMREFELDDPAGLIYCPFRSLMHLPTWRARRRVFERVAASLAPGGRFAWNAFVLNPFFVAEVHDQTRRHGETSIWERVRHVPADNRLDITAWTDDDRPRTISLWWTTRSEYEGLLDVAGLETEALYGWFDRRPFDDSSEEFVWVARKP